MATDPRLSIVIPTCRPPASVTRALHALTRQSADPGTFEVIVAIDGEQERIDAELAKLVIPYALTIVYSARRGRASTVNAGVSSSRGQIVVLLDDDMKPLPDFVTAHCTVHARAGSERLAVIGAAPIYWDDASPAVVRYVGAKFNAHLKLLADPERSISFRDVYTGNFSIAREVLLEVGGFDGDFTIYGNEDGELALRLTQAGISIRFSKEAIARQYYEKDFSALARDTVAKGSTAVLCALKHPESVQDLKLGTFHDGTRRARISRTVLLRLGERWSGLTSALTAGTDWLTAHRLAPIDLAFGVCLDYCYWVGARSALAEHAPEQLRAFFARQLPTSEHAA